jgi:hypothetical protein
MLQDTDQAILQSEAWFTIVSLKHQPTSVLIDIQHTFKAFLYTQDSQSLKGINNCNVLFHMFVEFSESMGKAKFLV